MGLINLISYLIVVVVVVSHSQVLLVHLSPSEEMSSMLHVVGTLVGALFSVAVLKNVKLTKEVEKQRKRT